MCSRKSALIILCLQFLKFPKISVEAASGGWVVLGWHKLLEDVLDLLKINHLLVNYYNGKIDQELEARYIYCIQES